MDLSKYKIARFIYLPVVRFIIFYAFLFQLSPMFSATYTSLDDYSGSWMANSTWTGGNSPGNSPANNSIINIYGKVTYTGSLILGNELDLNVYDTLIINGDLTLGNKVNLYVQDFAVIIVIGNIIIGNKTDIAANSYFVVTGDFTKTSNTEKGTFDSNDYPSNVFIGGTVSVPNDFANTGNGVFNCNASQEWANSNCNYGNFVDIQLSPINTLVNQVLCGSGISAGTISASQNICSGDNVAIFSGTAASPSSATYQWYYSTNSASGPWTPVSGATGQTFDEGVVTQTTYYYRKAQVGSGCSAGSNVLTVTVFSRPVTSSIAHN